MRRASALAVSIGVLAVAVFFARGFPIVPPSRLHVHCEAPSDPVRPLHPARWIDRQHLRNDVEFAEEIGVRFGDSRRKAEGRDGEHLRQRECTDALLAAVAIRHDVGINDLSAMRGERPVAVDAVLVIVFGAVFVRLARRIAAHLALRLDELNPTRSLGLLTLVVALLAAGAARSGDAPLYLEVEQTATMRVGQQAILRVPADRLYNPSEINGAWREVLTRVRRSGRSVTLRAVRAGSGV